jgi:hypothetical protein
MGGFEEHEERFEVTIMKRWLLTAAALGGLALTSGAQAQWVPTEAPVVPYDRSYPPSGYDPSYTQRWREPLASHAHVLSDEANHLAHYLSAVDGMSHLSNDARALASLSEYFHQSVEGGLPTYHLADQFRSVEREYLRLARQLQGAHHVHHDSHFAADWASMQQAFAQARSIVSRLGTAYGSPPPAYVYQPAPPPRVIYPRRPGRRFWIRPHVELRLR